MDVSSEIWRLSVKHLISLSVDRHHIASPVTPARLMIDAQTATRGRLDAYIGSLFPVHPPLSSELRSKSGLDVSCRPPLTVLEEHRFRELFEADQRLSLELARNLTHALEKRIGTLSVNEKPFSLALGADPYDLERCFSQHPNPMDQLPLRFQWHRYVPFGGANSAKLHQSANHSIEYDLYISLGSLSNSLAPAMLQSPITIQLTDQLVSMTKEDTISVSVEAPHNNFGDGPINERDSHWKKALYLNTAPPPSHLFGGPPSVHFHLTLTADNGDPATHTVGSNSASAAHAEASSPAQLQCALEFFRNGDTDLCTFSDGAFADFFQNLINHPFEPTIFAGDVKGSTVSTGCPRRGLAVTDVLRVILSYCQRVPFSFVQSEYPNLTIPLESKMTERDIANTLGDQSVAEESGAMGSEDVPSSYYAWALEGSEQTWYIMKDPRLRTLLFPPEHPRFLHLQTDLQSPFHGLDLTDAVQLQLVPLKPIQRRFSIPLPLIPSTITTQSVGPGLPSATPTLDMRGNFQSAAAGEFCISLKPTVSDSEPHTIQIPHTTGGTSSFLAAQLVQPQAAVSPLLTTDPVVLSIERLHQTLTEDDQLLEKSLYTATLLSAFCGTHRHLRQAIRTSQAESSAEAFDSMCQDLKEALSSANRSIALAEVSGTTSLCGFPPALEPLISATRPAM